MAESTGKAQADEHDSGASIMARGGQHGDTVAFGKLLRTVDSWSTRHEPMQASEIESEHEGGEEAWEDDEDDAEDKEGSRARCARSPMSRWRNTATVGGVYNIFDFSTTALCSAKTMTRSQRDVASVKLFSSFQLSMAFASVTG